jgi:hypothetical protein
MCRRARGESCDRPCGGRAASTTKRPRDVTRRGTRSRRARAARGTTTHAAAPAKPARRLRSLVGGDVDARDVADRRRRSEGACVDRF